MSGYRNQSFLLILSASFLFLLIYVTNPALNRANKAFPLERFNRDVEIILTGDTMLGRSVMTKSLDSKDAAYPFRRVADTLSSADLVFINLENAILENCPRTTTGLIFCARPELVEGLNLAGVDVVTLANNHSRNYGETGLQDTVRILKENGIESTGLGELVVKKIKGVEYGFLGFDFLTKKPSESDFELVRNAGSKVNVLFVGVHWGAEYRSKPAEIQRQWAAQLVAAGADVIVGHGPHWVQESEEIEGVPVFYSLGNFVFDQMWSQKTREGLVIKLTFRDGKMKRVEELPIFMQNWAQPEFVQK